MTPAPFIEEEEDFDSFQDALEAVGRSAVGTIPGFSKVWLPSPFICFKS